MYFGMLIAPAVFGSARAVRNPYDGRTVAIDIALRTCEVMCALVQ
jgi:hypothetical protein